VAADAYDLRARALRTLPWRPTVPAWSGPQAAGGPAAR